MIPTTRPPASCACAGTQQTNAAQATNTQTILIVIPLKSEREAKASFAPLLSKRQCGAGVDAFFTGAFATAFAGSAAGTALGASDPPVARATTSAALAGTVVGTCVTFKESTFFVVTTPAGGMYQLLSPIS